MIAWLRALISDSEWLKQRRIRDACIDLNAKCPACGHRNGKLKAVFVDRETKPNRTMMVEHTCQVCTAQFYEPTIVKPEKWVAAELLRDKA